MFTVPKDSNCCPWLCLKKQLLSLGTIIMQLSALSVIGICLLKWRNFYLSMIQSLLLINKFKLMDVAFNIATLITPKEFWNQMWGNLNAYSCQWIVLETIYHRQMTQMLFHIKRGKFIFEKNSGMIKEMPLSNHVLS